MFDISFYVNSSEKNKVDKTLKGIHVHNRPRNSNRGRSYRIYGM